LKLRPFVHRIKEISLDLLFPLQCIECGDEGNLLCARCSQALPEIEPPVCRRCGTPTGGSRLCRACSSHSPVIEGIRSLFPFEGTARKAVLRLKYGHLKTMAVPLGELMADYLRRNPLPVRLIVPVPLHPKRLRQRGYNQASLLADRVSQITGLPALEGMVRTRDTVSQTRTMSAAQRRENVAGAFRCRQKLDGESILLVDDVCTTGATLNACARALKAAGAGRVWGITVARETLCTAQDKTP
jgi:competence protein ComFC